MKSPSFRALLMIQALLAFPLQAQNADPLLRPNDVLDVVVLGQPTLSGDMTIDKEGGLNFPLIGRVEAQGLTAVELGKKLQTLLGAGYLKKPEVSVRVKEFKSRPVLIIGEVAKPGILSLKSDRSLLAVLAEAGGLTTNAGHELLVARPPEGMEAQAIEQFSTHRSCPV